ncbi:phage tail fiber protein [Jannaschia formosa]|uniref:phage tail fiber protein n=1 Tax=Jannaschia formosa TaxID=2259592 RepID=UPI000E1B89D6|nr:hypothetical protein [Jannaschia formosa]TFL16448.1 hypothetical protein DR046_20215 [Jannaschia formosa]
MSFGNTFENDLVALIFNATAIANLADNAATSPLTNLYISLHTADPGEAGDQTTNESAYSGYARQAVERSGSGWTVTGNVASLAASVDFPEAPGGTPTVTHVAVGTAASGAGKILASGALGSSITMASATIPRITTATTFTLD